MPKNIKLAKYAGFCYGVKRAVETVENLKKDNPDKNICVLGELIHNSQVIEELNNLGIKTIESIPKFGDGICVIRSHGEGPEIFEQIKKAGFTLYDLTCPDVKKVQQRAIELTQNGYYLVIVGKADHPEVIAIEANAKQYSDKIIVAADVESIKPYEKELKQHKKVGVVVQTTQMSTTLDPIVQYLTKISKELHITNTICPSTAMRQSEAKEIAAESDLMIIVGSKKSANTSHLAQISKEITNTIHIEKAEELDDYKSLIINTENVGVTAGASTPQKIINEVVNKLSNL